MVREPALALVRTVVDVRIACAVEQIGRTVFRVLPVVSFILVRVLPRLGTLTQHGQRVLHGHVTLDDPEPL